MDYSTCHAPVWRNPQNNFTFSGSDGLTEADLDPFHGIEPVARSLPVQARNRVRHRVAAARRLLAEAAQDANGSVSADPIVAAIAMLEDAGRWLR